MAKMFNYEADKIHDMVHPNLLTDSSHYVAECKDIILTEASPNYPKLTDYESEWLYFYEYIYEGGGDPVNLEYQTLDFDYHACVDNAIPFNYRRAILKGQTLVNLLNFDNVSNRLFTQDITIKQNVVYTIKGTLNSNNRYSSSDAPILRIKATNDDGDDLIFINGLSGAKTKRINQTFINTTSAVIHVKIFNQKPEKADFMIIEGDYTNLNIPYVEGMKYVQMPVLKTIGKNLLYDDEWDKNKRLLSDGSVGDHNGTNTSGYINVSNSDKITFSGFSKGSHCLYNVNKIIIGERVLSNQMTIDVSEADYIRVSIDNTKDYSKAQAEVGSVATSYEPPKSNILTVNEPVELRGVGDVYDELNLLTGKLSKRIGEVVFDGSDDENWVKRNDGDGTNTISFHIPLDTSHQNEIILDKFALSQSSSDGIEGYGYSIDIKALFIEIKRDRLNNVTVSGFKQWLSQNPITVQYKLTTEFIKTVDLSGSLVKPYEGTNNYYTSSDTIPPLCELIVPVESTGEQTLMDINQED